MFSFARKATLALALSATVLASASPAQARDYYGHRGGGDATGAAIAGGIIGLAIGAIIASSASNKHRQDRGYADGYYRDGYDRNGRYAQDCDRYGRDREGYSCERDGRDYYERRGYDERNYDTYRRGY